ncbi:MAG: ATP-binding protein, partial [Elusimicrobiaceae bacterium]|nr:ATP-binding protein [Elusimicrobiaceae bacterium]
EHAQPTPSASNEPEEAEEVMDPFEQLLAGKMPQTQPEQTTPPPAAQTAVPLSAPDANTDLQQDQATITTNKETETRVNTEKTMNENQAGKKTFIHLKRKPQPPVPAAPQPPKPAAPPAPQEEKHRTLVRKNRLSKTFMDKTTTIDHSIELPLSELKKHNWPLEVPLIPTYTLENMSISINRFAHATAISVIENPGRLYNPLVLHGASGTGKTHFLHAIGYALSKKYGQENIFITNGVRLSRGIQRYIMEGNIAKFEEFTSSVKALLIDDIHLISINEQNRSHLSKLLNDFMKQQKQIVITSKYPPENLAKLEELLNFKLDSGWISDLKHAQGPARMRIIQNMLGSNGINITNEDVNRFFGHANMSLGTVVRSIRRVRVLEKLMFQNNTTQKPSAITIFDQLLATKGEDQSSLIAQKSINDIQSVSVLGNGEWGRIGFFYPQNNSNMMNWMLFALQQRAKELNIPGGPELAVRSSYSTENIISSAFKIANLCDNKKLKGAVILGPSISSCEPSVRENFYDILTHMLEIMLIRCGVINFEEAAAPSTYVKILAELLR